MEDAGALRPRGRPSQVELQLLRVDRRRHSAGQVPIDGNPDRAVLTSAVNLRNEVDKCVNVRPLRHEAIDLEPHARQVRSDNRPLCGHANAAVDERRRRWSGPRRLKVMNPDFDLRRFKLTKKTNPEVGPARSGTTGRPSQERSRNSEGHPSSPARVRPSASRDLVQIPCSLVSVRKS